MNPFADLIPGQTSPMFTARPVYRQRPPEPAPQTKPQRRKDELDADKASTDAEVARATREDQIRKARAERIKAERDASRPAPEEAARQKENQGQLADLNMIAQQFNRVQELYNNDLKGVGVGSIGEYVGGAVGSPKMGRFDSQAKALAVLLKPLIRTPGEGTWTDRDQALLDRLVPSSWASDIDNEERLQSLRRFIAEKAKKHGGRARAEPIGRASLPDGWSIEEE